MLTKELLRFHNLSGYVKPMFSDPDDPRTENLANQLLETFRSMQGCPRTELEDSLMPLVNAQHDIKLARGLMKTLDDACETSGTDNADFPELRRELLLQSSRLLSAGTASDDPDHFRDQVFSGFPETFAPLQENIYGDLPDYDRILNVPDWSPQELIGRYNCSLAQSLLIYADSLDLTVHEPDPGKMRRFFKYLRFFRLLATVSKSGGWKNGTPAELNIRIDGPASILENGTAYGLKLASFLPALLQLPKWKMSAQVKIKNRSLKFNLDESAGLNRRFGTFSSYVPEEYRMFEKLFTEKSSVWKLSGNIPFLRKKDSQDFIFPDMTFTDGIHVISLELFHKWHSSQLKKRLDLLREEPDLPLIIGADRSIFGKKDAQTPEIAEHPLYGKKLFLFRDFPGVANVLKILEKNFRQDLL